jgi:hypothetical protein
MCEKATQLYESYQIELLRETTSRIYVAPAICVEAWIVKYKRLWLYFWPNYSAWKSHVCGSVLCLNNRFQSPWLCRMSLLTS